MRISSHTLWEVGPGDVVMLSSSHSLKVALNGCSTNNFIFSIRIWDKDTGALLQEMYEHYVMYVEHAFSN